MGFGMDTQESIIKPVIVEAVCSRYAALVLGAGGTGFARLPAGANSPDVVGFSGYDVDAAGVGRPQPVILTGGIVWVRAASAFSAQDLLRVADATGRVEKILLPRFKQFAAAAPPASCAGCGYSQCVAALPSWCPGRVRLAALEEAARVADGIADSWPGSNPARAKGARVVAMAIRARGGATAAADRGAAARPDLAGAERG